MHVDNSMRRGVNAQGYERLRTRRAEPVLLVGGEHKCGSWQQPHDLGRALQPSLTFAFQHRHRLHVGVGMQGRLIAGRRRLHSDTYWRRSLLVTHNRLVARATLEGLTGTS